MVVLGLGMIMAASMFPVGWARARQLNEFTVQQAVSENMASWLRLTGEAAGKTYDGAMFAGDLIWENWDIDTGYLQSDTRVHALHAGNLRFDPAQGKFEFADEEPWDLEMAKEIPDPDDPEFDPILDRRTYTSPQLSFVDRMYPPMRRRTSDDFDEPDEGWDDMFGDRRYCVAVFHRLRRETGLATGEELEKAREDAERSRTFEVYTVTLRRSQSSHRYARQDSTASALPDVFDRAVTVSVRALPSDQDLLLPTPWRVQLEFPTENTGLAYHTPPPGPPNDARTGVPTQVKVVVLSEEDEFLFDMFQDRAQLIDEVNGMIYTVNELRILDDGVSTKEAVLVLDQEIVVEDIDDGDGGTAGDGFIDDEERFRVVWVFPPPVQVGEREGSIPVFSGPSPVVGIDIRTVHISP